MLAVLSFVELYVSPFFVAVALAFLLNGLVNYFIIGNLGFEEDRREMGRQSLLWAALFLLVALVLFGLTNWIVSLGERIDAEGDVEYQTGGDILRVPNTPTIQ